MSKVKELRVSGNTDAKKLGGAVANYLEENGVVHISAMGAGAVNQAVKGIIIAKSYSAASVGEFKIDFGFKNKNDGDESKEVTVIVFKITCE